MKLIDEFKAFLLRGNVVDLAVAVVMAVAFAAVVTALIEDLITPLIAAVFGKPDFSALTFTINNSTFFYGDFLNAVFSFLTIAAAIFFFVVVPYNTFMARIRKEEPPDSSVRRCPECLSDIPAEARRCAFCTAEVTPTASWQARDEGGGVRPALDVRLGPVIQVRVVRSLARRPERWLQA